MRANTVMPRALTSASSRSIVSFGSKALGIVISPSAPMALAPHRQIAAIHVRSPALIVRGKRAMAIQSLPGWRGSVLIGLPASRLYRLGDEPRHLGVLRPRGANAHELGEA